MVSVGEGISRLDSELTRMSLVEHLDELRKRLAVSFVALLVGFLVCWAFAKPIFAWLSQPLTQFLPQGEKLAFTGLVDPFMLYVKVAALAGVFLASPVLLHQVWLFIAPALYRHERRVAIPFILATTVFFVAGGYFGWAVAFPMVCRFLLGVGSEFKQVITVNEYFSMASKVILGLGVVFELPVLIGVLARLGVVGHRFLLRHFRWAVLAIFILAAIITPTPDIPTQCVFAVPMVALYLIGVLVAWLFGKRTERPPAA
ncbi:MAG TPA: twin-arginine translocase subunit TatC [Thermoanaerobaculaceae bacterium]|nr:twin-arginine translocase subunit TatC [Thermoanaerobaculaceae bacterium]HPS78882.1 twin-arginine translocase subunit TatC [Thermoanaerobaculaceae bacterium]